MTSQQIRQSFLDFFQSKLHTLVPSSSLMPDSPGLLFTNAGMNQFVPIFLNQRKPDVSKWPGAIPALDTRAADTQKCIRAGGKHNDLEDVGLDTYHHTFFEMLGNWSFGDYFKQEAIEWAWELVTDVWKFPKHRLYATVYCPDDAREHWPQLHKWICAQAKDRDVKQWGQTDYQHLFFGPDAPATKLGLKENPDIEAAYWWAELFIQAGLDPAVHIVPGDRKDNFWMMGETGPCGPCSELHVDLTPQADTKGRLVNAGTAECIEIWNLVFIQFNANPDNTYSPLPAKHVDTGMGFERVAGIVQCTKDFTDFTRAISNYETDVFRPIFDEIEKLSGNKYGSTLPPSGTTGTTEQEKIDVAFRVIADHIRTLSFAIADGIKPGNTDRNYVLRRILRRAVRYGRTLGFHEPFFYKLIDVLVDHMGDVFPEIREKKQLVQETIRIEEEAFNRTLDRGIEMFEEAVQMASGLIVPGTIGIQTGKLEVYSDGRRSEVMSVVSRRTPNGTIESGISGAFAFKLYDTYGFPLDLTELMARERGLTVDVEGFNKHMEEQRERARKAQKREVIEVSQIETSKPTEFIGYDNLEASAEVLEAVQVKDKTAVILDTSPFYAEMGGQVGDTGELSGGGQLWRVVNTRKTGDTWLHFLSEADAPSPGQHVTLSVERPRRFAIQRHHTVTHLFHWALHEVVSPDATQKGSYVGPEKLTFDFNSAPLTPQQIADIERLVNERILENEPVSWREVPYAEVRDRKDVLQFFGDKYGDVVRVVQIGGFPGALDGYSMELCGGTHTKATGEIGLFRITGESAIAAGVRRIEAIAGLEAWRRANDEVELLKTVAGRLNAPVGELEKKIESMLVHQKELEKQLKSLEQKQAAETARGLVSRARTIKGVPVIAENLGIAGGDFLQSVADALKGGFKGVVVLGGVMDNAVALVATVSPEHTKQIQAGKLIQQIAPIVGGKGGGRPDNARGGGKDASKLDEALAKAGELVGA
ncbi:MAG TPA: alanine--tRNA ligase [Methylomirabilota bacterium]|nr:alanine--tRNA ligase [Methylomirabilota bacterium]